MSWPPQMQAAIDAAGAGQRRKHDLRKAEHRRQHDASCGRYFGGGTERHCSRPWLGAAAGMRSAVESAGRDRQQLILCLIMIRMAEGLKGGALRCIILSWIPFCVWPSHGSFNKAAEKLYISPPAVIKQINLLEESLGVQLFVRTHRGLVLTEAGKSLVQDARYIIQYCKDSVTQGAQRHARAAAASSASALRR